MEVPQENKEETQDQSKEIPVSDTESPVNEKKEEVGETKENDLPLESTWTMWYSTKPKASEGETFESKLRKIGSFKTLSEFRNIYSYLARPADLPKDANYSVFRDDVKPMWESYPHGGCWNLHIVKNNKKLSQLWEQLILAAIGEFFEEPSVVGVMVSKRSKEDVLSVWIKSQSKNIRFNVGFVVSLKMKMGILMKRSEKFKEAFASPDLALPIEYKEHRSSMKDRSTFHNGKFYVAN